MKVPTAVLPFLTFLVLADGSHLPDRGHKIDPASMLDFFDFPLNEEVLGQTDSGLDRGIFSS